MNENEEDVFYDEELFNQIVADASKYFKPGKWYFPSIALSNHLITIHFVMI